MRGKVENIDEGEILLSSHQIVLTLEENVLNGKEPLQRDYDRYTQAFSSLLDMMLLLYICVRQPYLISLRSLLETRNFIYLENTPIL